jgi:hypothetical protein
LTVAKYFDAGISRVIYSVIVLWWWQGEFQEHWSQSSLPIYVEVRLDVAPVLFNSPHLVRIVVRALRIWENKAYDIKGTG